MDNGLKLMDDRVARLTSHTEQQLEQMRQTMEQRIRTMQEDNGKRLEQMRATVDEKLQKTLKIALVNRSAWSTIGWNRCTRDWARCRPWPAA